MNFFHPLADIEKYISASDCYSIVNSSREKKTNQQMTSDIYSKYFFRVDSH